MRLLDRYAASARRSVGIGGSVPDRGDKEPLSAQETLVEKSERMEREHSARREVKKREERVRRISEQSERKRSRPEATGGARRLSSRQKSPAPDPTQVSPPPLASRAHRTDEARNFSQDERSQEANTSESRPRKGRSQSSQGPSAAETGERKVRISDPFPPIAKKKTPSKPKQSKAGRQTTTTGYDASQGSSLDLLAIEIEALIMAVRSGWKHMGCGDRITLIAAVFVVAGVLMPWLSTKAGPLQLGLNAGGLVHLAFAAAAMAIVVRGQQKATTRVLALTPRELDETHRRHSLFIVLLGFSSTVFSAYLVVVYGLAKTSTWPVTFHFGMYWTLAMSTGLSYGGFVRFRG